MDSRKLFDFSHHIFHYLVLTIILVGGLTAFFSFRNYPVIQFLIGIGISLTYVLWGIIHHYIDRDLSIKIVIEFAVIAVFVIIILWNVLI
ncbi:hypothetical protein HYT02_04830 [Candidatus Gottesmanbacteria bacterium]|nr:hypothetical protein [Candidatus Gottesmanbacteria bacterium]